MAGKTGTAQVRKIEGAQRGQSGAWKFRDHGLFICFAPVEQPRYAAAVVNRAQGESSRFREVLAAYRTAPQVTRTRLYLETLEIIYGRVKSMTIVDKSVEGLLPVFGGTAAAEKKP